MNTTTSSRGERGSPGAQWWIAGAVRRRGRVWVESLDALTSEDPAVQQAAADLLSDEGNFIDLAQSPFWIAQEHIVVG